MGQAIEIPSVIGSLGYWTQGSGLYPRKKILEIGPQLECIMPERRDLETLRESSLGS